MTCSCTPIDVIKRAWASDSTLNNAIPANDSENNAFFEEGFPPNLKPERVPKEYVVCEDFGTTPNAIWAGHRTHVNDAFWQYRIRIYSSLFGSSRSHVRDLAQRFKAAFKSIPKDDRCWDGGGMSVPKVSSERMDLTLVNHRIYEFILLVPVTSV